MQDPVKALDTKVREELGLDPDELGSPWGRPWSSFLAFCVGAIVPLVPFLLGNGLPAFAAPRSGCPLPRCSPLVRWSAWSPAAGCCSAALRQVVIGAVAAAVTYAVGTLIGTNLG
jgi:vacuolar iron transporter family protein